MLIQGIVIFSIRCRQQRVNVSENNELNSKTRHLTRVITKEGKDIYIIYELIKSGLFTFVINM